MVETTEKFRSPAKLNAQQKAATTHEAAMQIIDAEVAAREKKTERLRQLRLQHEAENPEPAKPARKRKN